MSQDELPWDRLATTDRKGNRIYLYPTDVKGRWKILRARLSIFLILFFLGLPWIRVNGHQAILFDIINHRFAIFGLTFWAHDAPLLFFVFGGAILSIAFITAIWGRIWCGWACPQTVFVEHVFRRLGRFIEGDSFAQRKLDESPLTLNKAFKKTAKWGSFTLLSLFLSHSFMAYIVGTEALAKMMKAAPNQNPGPFILMAGIATFILFDFGWFREQFCTLVCPYGRFQSVLMDHQSTVIAYDVNRGEPRRGTPSANSKTGDCVNCHRCVNVCPTGIDIRRGVQLECIACTACIDACDDVMLKLKKPLGLIRYGSQAMADGKDQSSTHDYRHWLKRSRTWVYLSLLMTCMGGLGFTLYNRSPIILTLTRAVDAPFQSILNNSGEKRIINHFKVDLRNQTFDPQEITLTISDDLKNRGASLVVSNFRALLEPGEPERADLFLQFPQNFLKFGHGTLIIQFEVNSKQNSGPPFYLMQEISLVGPL